MGSRRRGGGRISLGQGEGHFAFQGHCEGVEGGGQEDAGADSLREPKPGVEGVRLAAPMLKVAREK